MSSGGTSKKGGGPRGPGGQFKSQKAATASGVNKLTPTINPAGESEYIVEKITGKRYWNGRPQVQIKWQGYPPEENTWEPMENIGNCMVLLADFEAELFKRREHKKRLQNGHGKKNASSSGSKKGAENMTAQATLPVKRLGDAAAPVGRKVESGKAIGPKVNLTNSVKSSTPKPNAGHTMALSKSSEDKTTSTPASVPKSSCDDENSDVDIMIISVSSTTSSRSESSESDLLPTSKSAKKTIPTEKASVPPKKTGTKKMRIHSSSATSEDGIDEAPKSVPKPMDTPNSPQIDQTPQSSKKNKNKSPKESPNKSQKIESSDDSDTPLMLPQMSSNKRRSLKSGWKVPVRKAPFGLIRGLELDKILHIFEAAGKRYMFVTWKGLTVIDVVPLKDLKLTYPSEIIQFFENMKRITVPATKRSL